MKNVNSAILENNLKILAFLPHVAWYFYIKFPYFDIWIGFENDKRVPFTFETSKIGRKLMARGRKPSLNQEVVILDEGVKQFYWQYKRNIKKQKGFLTSALLILSVFTSMVNMNWFSTKKIHLYKISQCSLLSHFV